MAERDEQKGLGHGLPKCLRGLLELQKPLYLSGQRRHKVLQGGWVRSRVGTHLRKEADETVLLAFYSNTQNRKELWDHYRQGPHPTVAGAGKGKASKAQQEVPPSLEYCILDELYRDRLQSDEADATLLDRAEQDVGTRIGQWPEADSQERNQTVRLVFALASLRDDRSILQQAIEDIEDLKEEFAELLRPPAAEPEQPSDRDTGPTAPQVSPTKAATPGTRPDTANAEVLREVQQVQTTIDAAFASLHGLVENVEDAEALEIVGGFATSVEDHVQSLQGGVTARREQLESRRTVDELRAAAAEFLADVKERDAAKGIQADVREMASRWTKLEGVDPREATAEIKRLQGEVPTAVETLDAAHAEYAKLKREERSLRDQEATSRDEQRELDDRLDALNELRVAARRRHRTAEDALLTVLSPSLSAADSPALAAKPKAVQPLLDPEFSANRDLFDGASDPETPVHADEDSPEPQAAEATDSPEEAEPGTVATESEQDSRQTVTPPEELQPGPAEEQHPPGERDEPKTEATPAPTAAAPEVDPTAADATPREETTTEAPAAAPPEPPTPEWTELEQDVRTALAEALADEPPRLAEAFHMCRLAEELEIAAGQPCSALVEAALYANHLRQAHGELAVELREVIENVPSEPLSGGTSTHENAEALLRFSGAVVPALVAPQTGAAAWLKGLTHEGLPALYDFAQQAAEHSWAVQTARMDVTTFLRQAGRHLKREDALVAIHQDLASWKDGDATLPLGYVPANKVWRELIKNGPLGCLLTAITNEAPAADVRRNLLEIDDHDRLRECLDGLSARLLRKGQSIDQKIFKQIRKRVARPCALAHEYLSLAEAATEQADYHRQILAGFVGLIQKGAPGLHRELQGVEGRQDEDPLVRTAANVARCALSRVEQLVSPDQDAADRSEPTPDLIRASGLFPYPQVRVAESGLPEADADEALNALLSQTRSPAWRPPWNDGLKRLTC